MSERPQFTLTWDKSQSFIASCFKKMKNDEKTKDVVLVCDSQIRIKAHQMVLAASSPYFKRLLEIKPCKHQILILKDVPFNHLQSILEFMYDGEVMVPEESSESFFKTAARLEVKGLNKIKKEIKEESVVKEEPVDIKNVKKEK